LVARELLYARTAEAEIGAEEVLKPVPWWKRTAPPATTNYLLWVVLGTVVARLLFVIKKLLPSN